MLRKGFWGLFLNRNPLKICKGKDVKDDLGDMMVVMLNIMERQGISMEECLETAYNDIKDRKGRMVDGIFVKEGDH